jgi:hypothetical protein
MKPTNTQGDDLYFPQSLQNSLYCKGLSSEGWEWDGNLFVKHPDAMAKRYRSLGIAG